MQKILVSFTCLLLVTSAFAQKESIKVTDMLKIKSVNGVSLSKDGSKAVYTVTSIESDMESKWEYKYVNQIWMFNTQGQPTPKQMTGKDNATQPAISPDGKQLAFVRVVEGKPQIFLLQLDGGEAIQFTRSKYGASNPKWSPDGKRILFASSIPMKDLLKDSVLNPTRSIPEWPAEKPGIAGNQQFKPGNAKPDPDGTMEEARAYLDINATDRKAKVINRLNFQDEADVNADLNFTHFFIIDVNADAKPWPVTRGFYRYTGAAFMPDGKQLVLTADIDSLQNPDRSLESAIYLVNTDGSQLKKLLGQEGKVFNAPVVSPSGKWLCFQYANTSYVSVPALALLPLTGNNATVIDIPFDRNKSGVTWSDDEKYIYFTAQSNGGAPIYRVNVSTRKTEQLTAYTSGVNGFDLAGNTLVFSSTAVSNPSEVFIADAEGKNIQQVSSLNTGWLATKKIIIPEKNTFKNEKGMTVEYWVMKPANYEPGKKFPLLLNIHGGPASMWGPGENSMWHEFQYFCAKGYGVVYCNPRGSGGYGVEFLRGNLNDWGTGPTRDVLTALDKTVAEGWADTSRLLITGGSYAGYLVAWIIAHDQRFAAACSQRGVYDLPTFLGEGNAWRLVPNYFGGYPWDNGVRTVLERESPINYVQQIKTPYLIFHGDNDRRTGFVQSEMLYRSLKILNKPVEYVRHPGGTHELTRTGNNRQRIDQMLRTWEFFERWIGKK